MKIQVTQEDIDNGHPGALSECPIAHALNRELGGSWSVRMTKAINCGIPDFSDKDDEIDVIDLPSDARHFIDRFDNNRVVRPFTFDAVITAENISRLKAALFLI